MTRSVVITGASAGVGRATAVEFARHGWRVGLLARGTEGLEAAAVDVRAAGGEPLTLPADTSDAAAVSAAADRAAAEWGGIDVWVNCAMVTVFSPVRQMSAEEYRRVTEVTYLGYVHGSLAALKHMRSGGGTIVQVGSALAYRAIPLQSAYCAAKFAIRGFTESLRTELIHEGSRVRVTMVHLPSVNTPQFDWARNHLDKRPQPVPPIFQPEAVAHAIYYAAERAPRELWVGRSTVQAILGNLLAPGLLDRLMARKASKGQKTSEPAPAERADNLFEPVRGDFGAHGRFDRRASAQAGVIDPARLRGGLAAAGLAALLIAAAVGRMRLRSGDRAAP